MNYGSSWVIFDGHNRPHLKQQQEVAVAEAEEIENKSSSSGDESSEN